LAEAGYEFEVVCPGVDEGDFARDVPPRGYAERLALVKAKDVAVKFADALVVGADTVVDFDGEIIGKAANAKEAEQITRKLFSRPHKVITAVAVVRLSDGVEIVESDTTTVLPKPMTDEQIAEHIKTGSWRGKAGAYAIKEKGDEFVERIEGSLTNVMGLPTELLKRLLEKLIG
jgi:septum formation protein